MSLNIKEKEAVVKEVSANIANASTVVIANYRGIQAVTLTELRTEARKEQIYLHVLKNTLARRAFAGTPFEGLSDQLAGQLIYAASEDPVAAAKLVHKYAKKSLLALKGGAHDGKVLSVEEVESLATIPSREELLAKLAGMMQATMAKFARTLAALAEKRQIEEGASSAPGEDSALEAGAVSPQSN